MSRRGRTIVFTRPGEPLACVERDVADPRDDELLVRVTHAGVCGSDVHRLAGDLAAPPQPVCFGHEGVGIVEALGRGITHDRGGVPLAVGDRVYWSPPTPCGGCVPCQRGEPTPFCEHMRWPDPFGGPSSAAYQDLATVNVQAAFHRIPDQASSDAVIAFGCAMPTALGGMRRMADVAGADVVIQGAGPVGLAACVLCHLAGARRIMVIGAPQARLDMALRLGATEVIDLADHPPPARRERVLASTGGRGADVVIEAAGRIEAFGEGLDLLAPLGRYLVMGLYSGSAATTIDPVRLNNRNFSIIGSLGNPLADFGRNVEIAATHGEKLGFASLVTHRFALDCTEAAIDCVRRGEAIKAIVTPHTVG